MGHSAQDLLDQILETSLKCAVWEGNFIQLTCDAVPLALLRAVLVGEDGAVVAVVDGLVLADVHLGARRRHEGGDQKESERPHLASVRARSRVEGETLLWGCYLNIFTVKPHLEILASSLLIWSI